MNEHDSLDWDPVAMPGLDAEEVGHMAWLRAGGHPLPDFAVGSWDDTRPAELERAP